MGNTLVPQIWTPGSDYTFGVADSQIVYTRDGNDSLITYNPGVVNEEGAKVDIWIADREVPLLEGQSPDTNPNWQNRFILGDWQQPFYVDSQPSQFGLDEFAAIIDLESNRDTIQLHGSPENYVLEELNLNNRELGTAIFWQEGSNRDLIAFLPSTLNIDLEDDLFQFEGTTPPPVSFSGEAQQIGTAGNELLTGGATDSLGNVYVAGATTGSLGGENAGAYDSLVTKYDSSGNQVWTRQFGSANFDWISDLVADEQGNFYVAGYTEGDLAEDKNAEVSDVWLGKYDSNGNQIWLEQFGTEIINRTFAIDIDNEGNVYLSGYTIEENRNSQTDDSWVTKYDTNGNRQWFSEFGTNSYDEAYDVAVDNDGNVYSTGWTLGDLGGNNAGIYDVWLAKHNSNGELQFIEQFGTEDYEFPWGIDTDSQGNVYLTGWTLSDLGGNNQGSYDVWLAKYNSNGDRQWLEQFGTSGDDSLLFGDIEVDANGDIFVTGHTDSNLEGGNAGAEDVWVTKYNSEGDRQWLEQFGTSALDYSHDLSTDNAGNLYLTGITEGSLGTTNAGAADGWTVKLDKNTGNQQEFSGNIESLDLFPEAGDGSSFSPISVEPDSLLDDPQTARLFTQGIAQGITQTIREFSDSNDPSFNPTELLTNFTQVVDFSET
jgi:hypothetical protein